MHRSHHGDHAAVGLRQFRQRGNLARVRHAHLDDGDLVLGLQLQQLQRQAKVVVEIALRLQHAVPGRQNMRDDFLGGGLAGGTGHADQRLAPKSPHGRSELLQSGKRVVHRQQTRTVAGKRR